MDICKGIHVYIGNRYLLYIYIYKFVLCKLYILHMYVYTYT